jgi:hypothetical protein
MPNYRVTAINGNDFDQNWTGIVEDTIPPGGQRLRKTLQQGDGDVSVPFTVTRAPVDAPVPTPGVVPVRQQNVVESTLEYRHNENPPWRLNPPQSQLHMDTPVMSGEAYDITITSTLVR